MAYLSSVAGQLERPKLEFDPQTGKLRVNERNNVNSVPVDTRCCEAGNLSTSKNKDKIFLRNPHGRDIDFETMHISCKSDTYKPNHNYGGIIIYQYNGKSEWITENHTRCKSGYIVIQDTDSKGVKNYPKEPGIVHGAVYRNAFGESVNQAHVVGEGFAVRNGESKIRIYSSVFNNPEGSQYHDARRRMHELSEHCIGKIVEYWKAAGPFFPEKQNFYVKQLLEDFDE